MWRQSKDYITLLKFLSLKTITYQIQNQFNYQVQNRCNYQLQNQFNIIYRGSCILRPPILPEKYGLKIEGSLKMEGYFIEDITSGVTDGWSGK